MNKLSRLTDHLQKLASTASPGHRSQLLKQVNALRARLGARREYYMEFLQLSEGNANGYLLDIVTEIQQQSEILDKLKKRLEAAKELRGEAAKLQGLYESITVATMKNLRETGKATSCRLQKPNIENSFSALPRPLPEDDALFREVDSVLTEIKHCYTELYKFWTEEISCAMEAFKKRHVDRRDFERWRTFHANLKQTIESWKVQYGFFNSRGAQYRHTLLRISYPVMLDKLYSTTMHACLGYAGLASVLVSFRLTPLRKPTSGR